MAPRRYMRETDALFHQASDVGADLPRRMSGGSHCLAQRTGGGRLLAGWIAGGGRLPLQSFSSAPRRMRERSVLHACDGELCTLTQCCHCFTSMQPIVFGRACAGRAPSCVVTQDGARPAHALAEMLKRGGSE